MKQGFEGTSRHAADGEPAGDPLWLHDREKVVGVVRDADPRLVGGELRSAETAMVPRHHAVSVSPAVDVGPSIVRSAEPIGNQHGNSMAVVVPSPQTRAINGCDRLIPQTPALPDGSYMSNRS